MKINLQFFGGRGASSSTSTGKMQRTESRTDELIFGTIVETNDYYDIDGYSNARTLEGALGDLAKAVETVDKGEAENIRMMIHYKEYDKVLPARGESGVQYILDYQDVPSASNPLDPDIGGKAYGSKRKGRKLSGYENDGYNEYANARYYLHTRIIKHN